MNSQLRNSIVASALILGLFGIIGTGLVATIEVLTAEQREATIIAARLKNLHAVIPPSLHDNDILADKIIVHGPPFPEKYPAIIYRARKQGKPVAAAIEVTTPKGYGGPMRLLIGIDVDGRVMGVRVLEHRETPGLGDAVEADRSDWIFSFNGKSIGQPPLDSWAVKKDGGVFDQFTGATITPRAVVNTVKQVLLYYNAHKDWIFAEPPSERPADKPVLSNQLHQEPMDHKPSEVTQ